MTTVLRWGAHTHEGRVRQNNEDTALVDEGASLFAVADGMGGHAAGEVASQVAVEALRVSAAGDGSRSVSELVDGVRIANRAVYDRAGSDPELRGMGTTLCALALVEEEGEERIAVVNVGDSRVYLMQQGELTQLTQDHSLVEDMVRSGQISAEEAKIHPQRNIVTRVLGIDPDVEVDSWQITPFTGDRYLLCSDGLFDEVDEAKIASVMRRRADPQEAAVELVELANHSGGRDNITCVVVEVADDGGRAREASAALADDRPARTPSVLASSDLPPHPRDITDVHEPVVVAPSEPPARPTPPAVEEPRHRRFTWRVGLFLLALLIVVGAAVGTVAWFARGTYFVGLDGDEVVIYKGQPGGVLWFDPTVEERTELTVDDIRRNAVDDVEEGHETGGDLESARRYVENLRRTAPSPTTTSTTTSTSTTTAPGGTPTTGTTTP